MQEPLHQTYQDIAHPFKSGYTLKTDVWQETRDHYEAPIDADEYLEILPDLVEKAKQKGLNVTQGSILEMPYKDDTFDTLIDTSTIDHVEDYEKALDEYRRVLKPEGRLLLITWTTKHATFSDGTDLAGGTQYYFNHGQFYDALSKRFTVHEVRTLQDAVERKVVAFLCN